MLHVLHACLYFQWLLLQAEFAARVIVVRERMETKEMEVNGEWLTEAKMKKSGDYTP